MNKAVFIFLIAFSTTALADDKQGQKSVYDDFREWLKPSAGATVDEQVTASIKRHMANLLYPVDMSSFVGPDKDSKFRDLIMTLQKQMGAPVTGILTADQFYRLAEASRDIDDRGMMLPPGKFVSMSGNGSWVSARGTGAMDDRVEPINKVHIFCWKAYGTCELNTATFNSKFPTLDIDDLAIYEIKTWTPNRVTAIQESTCATASMTIDVKAETATIVNVPHADVALCLVDRPSIWTLVDGAPVAQKFNQDRTDKTRALIYEPAKKLMPIQK